MTNKVIIYFHGYASTPLSPKVDTLRNEANCPAYAFPIDVNPAISVPYLTSEISKLQEQYPNHELVFVGTSLGGWYASKLNDIFYNAKSVLINPCYNPNQLLRKYNLDNTIYQNYTTTIFQHATIISSQLHIANDDEIINFKPVLNILKKLNTTFYTSGGHRFNGEEFTLLAKSLKG